MNVRIDEIFHKESTIIVAFSTEHGSAMAYWDGEEPIVKREYQVEVDIEKTLVWNEDIVRCDNCEPSINIINNRIRISGIIDSIDDDGYTILRVGNYIIPFIASGNPYQIGTNIALLTKIITLSSFD